MTTEEKAKAYDEAIKRAKDFMNDEVHYALKRGENIMCWIFPELTESKDERIRKTLIDYFNACHGDYYGELKRKDILAWLKKQGEFYTKRDVDNAYIEGMAFAKDELEKQGKQKGYTFKSIPRLIDMIEPSDKAKAYCQKLIDTLVKEGYNTDAKIVEEVLKGWNGEDVPMAIMDEQKPVFEMKIPEESLGIDSDTYNKIVDECIYGDGEQNPADKLEPKFHKGEWIVWKDKCYKVNYNGCGYELVDQDGLSTSLEYATIDENAHIWDVTTDAKDGDVLHSPNHRLIWIYKDIQYYHVCVNMNYVKENFSTDGFIVIPTDVCPATKDEQTILSVRIKESGYEWDAEKKELKKINSYCQENCKGFQEIGKCFADGECKAKREAEQKPTDEEMKTLLRTEYEKGRADAIAEIQKPVDCIDCTNSKGCINCEDGNMKETLVQKPAWTEADEKIGKDLIDFCIKCNQGDTVVNSQDDFAKWATWLKSLKPQNRWKPSEKQMEALKNAIHLKPFENPSDSILWGLYEQLKKL